MPHENKCTTIYKRLSVCSTGFGSLFVIVFFCILAQMIFDPNLNYDALDIQMIKRNGKKQNSAFAFNIPTVNNNQTSRVNYTDERQNAIGNGSYIKIQLRCRLICWSPVWKPLQINWFMIIPNRYKTRCPSFIHGHRFSSRSTWHSENEVDGASKWINF